jgi:phospholipase D
MKKNRKNSLNYLKFQPIGWLILGSFLTLVGIGFMNKSIIIPSIPSSKTCALSDNTLEVAFTPNQQCQKKIIDCIEHAKTQIQIQAYGFTDYDIQKALLKAIQRGVKIQILLDKSNKNTKKSMFKELLCPQIQIRFDYVSGIAHNKIILIDNIMTITGSYNFTKSAYSKNAENVLFIRDSKTTEIYRKNFEKRWACALPCS